MAKKIQTAASLKMNVLGACATSVIALMSGVTWAQQPTSQSPGVEEVIVTATKRSTTLQETPISITAVTGEDLLDRGIGNFTALAQETPGISMKSSGPGRTEFEMRGLTSNGGSSPTVGFYLDDVPMSPPAMGFMGKVAVDPDLYDLNHVEVLRGPQGTLYGAGSMGGTIKLLTNQPDATGYHASAEVILSGTEGGGFNHTENAMGNIPLIDHQLAIRAVATQSTTSGWIDRIVLNPFPDEINGGKNRGNILGAPVQTDYKNVNSEELHGGRISALYTPTDRLTIGATVFYQRIGQSGQNSYDNDPGTLAHYQPFDVKEPSSDSFSMWSINANYKFDGFDVTSVTSNWNRSGKLTQDYSEQLYSPSFFGLPSYYPANGGAGAAAITENDKTRQLSEEFRVTSSGDGRLQWLGGLFYSRFVSQLHIYSFVDGLIPLTGLSDVLDDTQPDKIDQKAAFGEVSYKILDGLKVTAGMRYFQYDSTVTTTENGLVAPSGSMSYETIATGGKAHGIDPKFNISYEIDKDLMVYATAERGFRPGGGNQPIPTTGSIGTACLANLQALGKSGAPASFGPDNVWSYELGEKYKIGGITLDGAIYHERWSSVQQLVGLPCGYPYYDNFGTANVNGGEMEAKAFVTSNWLISGNFGYSHSTLIENNPTTGAYKGQDLQDIPLMTASGSLTYFFGINDDWQASVRGAYDWTDGLAEPVYLSPSGHLPAHGIASLRATAFNDRWTVAAFVNNLTNKHAQMEVDGELSLNIPAFYRLVSNQPRTMGVDVNVKF